MDQHNHLSFIERIAVKLIRLTNHTLLRFTYDACYKPSYIKSYGAHPKLKHRIFLPLDYNANGRTKYPLFIEIHGGGYIMGKACEDDAFCSYISTHSNAIVVSIEYRKSPEHQYPIPLSDCADTIRDIMSDSRLAINHKHIAIGGMSAGGNLALSVAQKEEFRGMFNGMVIWYPIVDWTVSLQKRLNFRPKNEDGSPDGLVRFWPYIERGYLPHSVDRTDPSISPFYSANNNFPAKAYFIDSQHDVLSYDTSVMANKLAGSSERVKEEEFEGLLGGWTAGGVRWSLVLGQNHGFNSGIHKLKGLAEVKRTKATEEIHKRIANWLSAEVFS